MTDLAEPFFRAAERRELVLQVCVRCESASLPPRVCCPCCGGSRFEWRAAAGTARLESFSVLHRSPGGAHRDRLPYVYALVELDEGVRLVSTVVGGDPADLRVGLPLRVSWPPDGDALAGWPVFTPA